MSERVGNRLSLLETGAALFPCLELALDAATQEIHLETYTAARRGVRVRLLLQGRPDYLFVYYATQYLYRALLRVRIEIAEYTNAELHAKVALVDRAWATIGSSNIDPFSLWLSREANVIVYDKAVAAALYSSRESAINTCSQRVGVEFAHRQRWYRRLRAWAMYKGGRWLASWTGFAARDEL